MKVVKGNKKKKTLHDFVVCGFRLGIGTVDMTPGLAKHLIGPVPPCPSDTIMAGQQSPFFNLVQPFQSLDSVSFFFRQPVVAVVDLLDVSGALAAVEAGEFQSLTLGSEGVVLFEGL